jgi:hypothetical protein
MDRIKDHSLHADSSGQERCYDLFISWDTLLLVYSFWHTYIWFKNGHWHVFRWPASLGALVGRSSLQPTSVAEPAPNKPLRPDFALAGQQQRGMQVALQQCCICHPECLKWSSLMLMKWQNLGHSDCHFERSKPGNFQLGSSGQRQLIERCRSSHRPLASPAT